MSTNQDSRRVAIKRLRPAPALALIGPLTATLAVSLSFSGLAAAQSAEADSSPSLKAPLSLPSSRFPDREDEPVGLLRPLGEKPAEAAPAAPGMPDGLLLVKIPDLGEAPGTEIVEFPDVPDFNNYFQPPPAAAEPAQPTVQAAANPEKKAEPEDPVMPVADGPLEDDMAAARGDLPPAETSAETTPAPAMAVEPAEPEAPASEKTAEQIFAAPPPAPEVEPAPTEAAEMVAPIPAAPPDDSELAAALAETTAPPIEEKSAATIPPPDPLAPPPPPPDLGTEASSETPPAEPAKVEDSSQVQMAALPPASETPVDESPAQASLATRILFEGGSAELLPAGEDLLTALAEKLTQTPETRIQLLAFAEKDTASVSAARSLSLSRARMVRNFLIDQGVPATRVLLRPLGDKYKDGPADRVDVEALQR